MFSKYVRKLTYQPSQPQAQKGITMRTHWMVALTLCIFLGLSLTFVFFTSASAQSTPEAIHNFAVGVDATNEQIIGHRPVDTEVVIINISEETRPFTATIWYGGQAWGGENYPYSYTVNSELDTTACDQNGCSYYYWHGELEPDEQASFYMQTFTGDLLGTFQFITVEVTEPFNLHVQRDLTIVEGTESVHGTISTQPDNQVWNPGDYRMISLLMEAPKLTRFRLNGPFESTCPFGYLPTMFTGEANRTYEVYSFYTSLSYDAEPGPCTITAEVESMWTEELFTVEYTFVVGNENPLILNTDYFSMTAGTTQEFYYLANDEVNLFDHTGWSTGIFATTELPFEYESHTPGGLRAIEPPTGVYTFTYFVSVDGQSDSEFSYLQVLPEDVEINADVWANVQMELGDLTPGSIFTLTVTFGNNGSDAVSVWEVVTLPDGVWTNGEVLEGGEVVTYLFWPTLQANQTYSAEISVAAAEAEDLLLANNASAIAIGELPEATLSKRLFVPVVSR